MKEQPIENKIYAVLGEIGECHEPYLDQEQFIKSLKAQGFKIVKEK